MQKDIWCATIGGALALAVRYDNIQHTRGAMALSRS